MGEPQGAAVHRTELQRGGRSTQSPGYPHGDTRVQLNAQALEAGETLPAALGEHFPDLETGS